MALKDETWFPSLPEADRGFIQTKGLDSADLAPAFSGLIGSYRELEGKHAGFGVGDFIKVPKAADDPAWTDFYKAVGVPAEPAGYDFSTVKLPTGAPAPQEFVDKMRAQAHGLKLPQAAAVQIANETLAQQHGVAAEAAERDRISMAAAEVELHQAWAGQYDFHTFRATKAAEAMGLKTADLAAIGRTAEGGYAGLMRRLATFGAKMGESEFHAPNSGGDPQARGRMTPEQSSDRLLSLRGDPAWRAKFVSGDAEAVREHRELIAIGMAANYRRA